MKLSRRVWSRCTISNERDLRPRINQNPKFAPRSETDEDPRCFHMGVLPPAIGVTCLHLSIFSVISVKRLVVVMLPTTTQQRLQSRLNKFQHIWLNKISSHFVLKLRCGGLFMLKAKVCSACCAKNMTRLILKTSWKFLTRSPVKDFA